MGLTTDRNDPDLHKTDASGQQKVYLVLSEEERKKGFVRPVRNKYIHLKCGTETTMGMALSETYARDPKFYGATFCCGCGIHIHLKTEEGWQFEWSRDGEPVGSTVEEAQEYLDQKQAQTGKQTQGRYNLMAYPQEEAFLNLLIAAMKDAVIEKKLTQLQAQLDADGKGKLKRCRIIVVPEELDHTWPSYAPAGTPKG